jgi:hypothetical protein
MTGEKVVKSVSLNIPLGMTIRKLLETHDTTSLIRHLVEAMDEGEIRFHDQTTPDLVIETDLEGIESAKTNYNYTTSELTEEDRTEETRADGVHRRFNNKRK